MATKIQNPKRKSPLRSNAIRRQASVEKKDEANKAVELKTRAGTKQEKVLDRLARGEKSGELNRRLKSGTVLVREYNGERHTVTVVPEPLPVGETGGSKRKVAPNADCRGSARGAPLGETWGCGKPCLDALHARGVEPLSNQKEMGVSVEAQRRQFASHETG